MLANSRRVSHGLNRDHEEIRTLFDNTYTRLRGMIEKKDLTILSELS